MKFFIHYAFRISTFQTAAYINTTRLFGYTNIIGLAALSNFGSSINSIIFNRPFYNLDMAMDDVDSYETATLRFCDISNDLFPEILFGLILLLLEAK